MRWAGQAPGAGCLSLVLSACPCRLSQLSHTWHAGLHSVSQDLRAITVPAVLPLPTHSLCVPLGILCVHLCVCVCLCVHPHCWGSVSFRGPAYQCMCLVAVPVSSCVALRAAVLTKLSRRSLPLLHAPPTPPAARPLPHGHPHLVPSLSPSWTEIPASQNGTG